MIGPREASGLLVLTLIAMAGVNGARAQNGQTAPNALQGFAQNRDKPIQIKAQTFEVRDKDKVATFTGNVHVVQGDTTIRCRSLIVTYTGDSAAGGARSNPATPGANSQISKLEAIGGVIVSQKDQTATGDKGLFDIQSNTITLSGNVVISQKGNVMRGDRMIVDLTTGVSRIESGKSSEPVRMLIPQGQQNSPKPGAMPGGLTAPPKIDMLRPAQPN